MSFPRYLAFPLLLAGAPLAAQSFPAQTLQTEPRPTPDADALADAMRRLGSNPRDLTALITAAELSLKLGDVTAAAALLKRADEIDPMNGRVKAGMARILVSQERPGEALRYFDQAAGYGLDPRTFAGDRGLAYDLIGEPERAQRDYRVALKAGQQDEVQRRYALSLGISGKREPALEQIDALLRKNDRGAWRARAFILAMTGDVAGAEKIATTMMPPGMAAGLQPFFVRLAALPATDRAFAVHFGEVRATPQRIADRQLAPALPALAPEPQAAPVQVAAATPAPVAEARDRRRERRSARDRARERAAPVVVATRTPTPAPAPALPPPPSYGNGVAFAPPREVAQVVPRVAEEQRPARVSAAPSLPPATRVAAIESPSPPRTSAPASSPPPVSLASARQASPPRDAPAVPSSAVSTARAVPAPSPGVPRTDPPSQSAARVATAPATAVPSAIPPAQPPAPARVAAASPAPVVLRQRLSEDTILARIMAGISIPASELAEAVPAAQPARAAPVAAAAPVRGTVIATAASIAAAETARRTAAAERLAREQAAVARQPATGASSRGAGAKEATADAAKPVTEVATTRRSGARRGRASAADQPVETAEAAPVDPKVAARQAAAERKAAAAKKLADAKKLAERKQAAEEAKAAKADPPRIWVQVAGGARESDLPKAWAGVKGKASALAGKAAYTTPLRATNRVVTGPFKTDAEARAFVNTLAKQGISAFPFTSEKGQKMTKLGGK